jgi:elongation factor P
MAIRYEGQIYKVLGADYHPGQGKMGGSTHARLKNLSSGALWEHGFRAELKLDDLPVEKQSMDYLYADGDEHCFMNPDTFEQVAIPAALIGEQAGLLAPEMRLTVELIDGRPVSVVFPDVLEFRVADTAPAVHAQQDSTWKPARLENGLEVMVPQFIKTGDAIRLETASLKYMERARAHK